MSISEGFIRAVLILIPGIAARSLFRHLYFRGNNKDWEDYAEVLLFSAASYFVFWIASCAWKFAGLMLFSESVPTWDLQSYTALFDEAAVLPLLELFGASVTGVLVALLASNALNREWITLLGRKLGITRRFRDEEVWGYFHEQPGTRYLIIRDHKLRKYYLGWIKGYSEPGKARELILRDVSIFDEETGVQVGESDTIYLSRESSDLTIEIPKL